MMIGITECVPLGILQSTHKTIMLCAFVYTNRGIHACASIAWIVPNQLAPASTKECMRKQMHRFLHVIMFAS